MITTQGIREYKYNNTFSLSSFYTRRALRILPVLVVALIFYFFLHPLIIDVLKLTPQKNIIPWKALFLFPYYYKSLSAEVFIYTYVIWSILLFCQFYLLWGLVIKFLSRFIPHLSILLLLASIVEKLFLSGSELTYNLSLLDYGASIGIGALLAINIRHNDKILNWIKQLSNNQIQLIYGLTTLGLISLYIFVDSYTILTVSSLLLPLIYAFVVMEQTFAKHSILKLRNFKVFVRVGKISYGMIAFSPIVAILILTALESVDRGIESPIVKILFPFVTFVITWIFSNLYFNLVESYFRRVKREFKKL